MRVTKTTGALMFSASKNNKNENSPAFKAIISETGKEFLPELYQKACRRGVLSQPDNLYQAFMWGRDLLKRDLSKLSDDLRFNLRYQLWEGATFFGVGERKACISITAFFDNIAKQKSFFRKYRPDALTLDMPDAILLPYLEAKTPAKMREAYKKRGYEFMNNYDIADAFKREYLQEQIEKNTKPSKFQEFVNKLYIATKDMEVREL